MLRNGELVYLLAALVTGALVPFQLAFNAQLREATRSPYTAGLVIFAIGAVAMTGLVLMLRQSMPSAAMLAAAPWTVWLGGLIAVVYILAVVVVTPRIGVGTMAVFVVAGQILTALVLDHLGAFGNPQASINLWRLAGALLVVSGAVLIRTH